MTQQGDGVTQRKDVRRRPSDREYKKVFFELLGRTPHLSAYHVLSRGQKLVLVLLLAAVGTWLWLDWLSFLYVLNGALIVYYLVLCSWKIWLIGESLVSRREIQISTEDIAELRDEDCPTYTILVPLYHETEVFG